MTHSSSLIPFSYFTAQSIQKDFETSHFLLRSLVGAFRKPPIWYYQGEYHQLQTLVFIYWETNGICGEPGSNNACPYDDKTNYSSSGRSPGNLVSTFDSPQAPTVTQAKHMLLINKCTNKAPTTTRVPCKHD